MQEPEYSLVLWCNSDDARVLIPLGQNTKGREDCNQQLVASLETAREAVAWAFPIFQAKCKWPLYQ